MTTLDEAAFPDFFAAVHGYAPFRWQCRLLHDVASSGWPDTLKLPTASGKTAVLDVAVFALALDAARPAETRRHPRRVALVVDRRIVVDSAFERARRLADVLAGSASGAVSAVRDALLSLGGEQPLVAALLRGGIYREDRWARTPLQPVLLCSTVDQVGSRLLHRGYGIGPRTWPIHAGLLGEDSLVILDEAHCSRAFLETLRAVRRFRRHAERPLARPHAVVAMTATPQDGARVFGFQPDQDLQDAVLKQRLEASKPLVMKSAPDLARAIGDEVKARATPGATVLVVVNQVATARAVMDRLARMGQGRKPELAADTLLLTGRSRPVERDALVARYADRLLAGRARPDKPGAPPLIVVATQCVEVGADLDADALITEVCPLDSLRQRLGRLDRLGHLAARGTPGTCTVMCHEKAAWNGEGQPPPDPIYGEAKARTWSWLAQQGAAAGLDGGALAFEERCADADANLNAPSTDAPVLFPAYLDLWVQTGPEPAQSPEPGVFLHGPSTDPPDAHLVWRADLDPEHPEQWAACVSLCPPVMAEALPVRLHLLRAWLAGESDLPPDSDVEGMLEAADQRDGGQRSLALLRWRGPGGSELVTSVADLRPGDTLILPIERGGCDRFGWNTESTDNVTDVAVPARVAARRAPVLRVTVKTLGAAPPSLLALAGQPADEPPDDLEDAMRAALRETWPADADPLVAKCALALSTDAAARIEPHPGGTGWVVIGRTLWADGAADFTDEDDSSSRAPAPVALLRHGDDVRTWAERFVRGLGLPQEIQDDLALAGWLHDVGKADPRFQTWLAGGDRVKSLRSGPLAKSTRLAVTPKALHDSRVRAGYPEGGRHELLSVRLAESAPELLARAHDRDLVLHLVASHHGFCRPFAPVVLDDKPLDVALELHGVALRASSRTGLERLDSGVAERFWLLVRRYGWWGLSFLEACLRLADHRASEQAERGGSA